jgi:hypothetical protein
MATMSIAQQITPKKPTLASAELDSFLFEADPINASRSRSDQEGGGTMEGLFPQESHLRAQLMDTPPRFTSRPHVSRYGAMDLLIGDEERAAEVNTSGNATTSVASNASAMLSPSQRDTVKFSDSIRGPPALQRRLKVPTDDDVSISSDTILSRDVTVYSKGDLIANMEDVDEIMHHLTRPSPAANDPLNPADLALMAVAREALARDACAASAKSFKSSTVSRASGASKPSTRSSRIVNAKRGPSLERDISKCVLQTAAGGADEAHFLVLADGSTELAYCAQAILQDLLMTKLPEKTPAAASPTSTRSINSRSELKSLGSILDDTVSDVNVGIKSVESNDTLHAANGTSRRGLSDDSVPSEDELTFLDGLVLTAVVAIDTAVPPDSPTSQTPSDSRPESVIDEMHESLKQEYMDPGRHETAVVSPSLCIAQSGSWISFGTAGSDDDIRPEFEYHDAADDNGSTFESSAVMPSLKEHLEASSNETGSVVMDLLGEESEDEDEPDRWEEQGDAVFDDGDLCTIQDEPEGRYMASYLETGTEEASDDGTDAASQISEARNVILSLAEHAAHAYNLEPVESMEEQIDDSPLELTTSEETPAHDESQQQGAVEPAATSCEKGTAIHHVFESSRNGFGGIYAFDMDEEEDWTTFDASLAESSSFSPSRQTVESSADSDASNTVYSAPLDSIKRDVAQPDSPTSVVSMGSRLAEVQ